MAHPWPRWCSEQADTSRRRGKARRRIFSIDSALDRVTSRHDVVLREGEPLTSGDLDLESDEVEPRHHLRHRVLHLEPGVDLEEVESSLLIDEELDRSRVDIARRSRRLGRGDTHERSQVLIEDGAGTLLDNLLVPALNRALPFEEVDDVARRVREDLELDVPRSIQAPLEVHRAIGEGSLGLAPSLLTASSRSARSVDDAHPLPAASGGGLDEDGIAESSAASESSSRSDDGESMPGITGTPASRTSFRASVLSPSSREHLGWRADECRPASASAAGKRRVLGEEAIARMHGLGPCVLGSGDDRLHVEVVLRGLRPPEAACFIGNSNVERRCRAPSGSRR